MKTTLTKLQQKLYQFASPSAMNPGLNTVLFNGVRAVATDSFRLVETIKLKTIGEAIPDTGIRRDSLKAVKTMKVDSIINIEKINGQILATPDSMKQGTYVLDILDNKSNIYPNYQMIKDDAAKREYIDVIVDGTYLAEIAEYLAQFQTGRLARQITMRVPVKPEHPVILEARSETEAGYALLMPCRKNK